MYVRGYSLSVGKCMRSGLLLCDWWSLTFHFYILGTYSLLLNLEKEWSWELKPIAKQLSLLCLFPAVLFKGMTLYRTMNQVPITLKPNIYIFRWVKNQHLRKLTLPQMAVKAKLCFQTIWNYVQLSKLLNWWPITEMSRISNWE